MNPHMKRWTTTIIRVSRRRGTRDRATLRFKIPLPILHRLGWRPGDTLTWEVRDGRAYVCRALTNQEKRVKRLKERNASSASQGLRSPTSLSHADIKALIEEGRD